MKNIAIIGTAGRNKGSAAGKPMTKALWVQLRTDAELRFFNDAHLISGGAAWIDHLAVELFLDAYTAKALTLHLPAPFKNGKFEGGYGTAGGTCNFYHEKFSEAAGVDSLKRISWAIKHGAIVTLPDKVTSGYGEMFARNDMVAKDATDGMLAYTWGEGSAPEDGGTVYTWNKNIDHNPNARRVHVPLSKFLPS